MVWVTEAKAPDNLRIYAIGDVHGCLDMLRSVHDAISEDLAQFPVDDWAVVHVGDYVDRGPDSRGVVDYLADLSGRDTRMVFLMGNHDLMFARSVRGDRQMLRVWMENGGQETLGSYGLTDQSFMAMLGSGQSLDEIIPSDHVAFLEGLDHAAHMGDYFFVHAGIDPDRSLEGQDLEDMLWIRDRFVRDGREYDAVVIHGHTPTRKVDVKANRIGIDTGAVYGGDLTCLILDGVRKARLGSEGRKPLI